MADTYKSLGQNDPSAATLTTNYTVPGATSAIVSTVTVCNRSATGTTFRIAHRPAGAAIANQHYLFYDTTIEGNTTVTVTIGITMATTDVLSVYATLATLSFNTHGMERT